jgi:drug/metabolite transporter (DMT)-like permease
VSATPSAQPTRTGPNRWAALTVGVVAISTASILIRLADVPPLVPGAWRTLLAALLLTPWGLPALRRERCKLTRRDVWLLVACGLLLAAHFATWITSLAYTTVASSVILVTTNPLWVGLASHWLLKERLNRAQALAIGIALLGSVVISYGDLALSGRALLGDLLALVGALAISAYMLVGRALRHKLSTLAFVWPCYGIAGLTLLLLCLVGGQSVVGLSGQSYLMLVLLALVPQIVGHTAVNWALAVVSPVVVTLAILGEPIGSSLLALVILHETPPPTALLGAALILAGIYLASRQGMRRDRTKKENAP